LNFYPKVIALDLDQTIMSEKGEITPRTLSAINTIIEKGVDVVFITGRPPRWMFEVEKIFNSGIALIANGAISYDLADQKIIEVKNISTVDQKKIIENIRNTNKLLYFAVEQISGFRREKGYVPRWDDGIDLHPCDDILERIDEGTYKILVKSESPQDSPDDLLSQIKKAIQDSGEATYCNEGLALIEISSKYVNKGEALKKYCESKQVKQSEVVAIGDSVNDFPMFEWAEHSWIMESGNKVGRNVAKYIAPNFADDGAAQVIESIINYGI
jgi:Cof subfamily protein (haloacid dehalogenase superfamily)